MNIKLIFPPVWDVTQPYLSIPSLYSYLENENFNVTQFDLNLFSFDTILSKKMLTYAKNKINSQMDKYNEKELKKIKYINLFFDDLVGNIYEIKETLRSKSSLNIEIYKTCIGYINKCLDIWSLAHNPEKITLGDYKSSYNYEKIENILFSIKNKEKHIFYKIFNDYIDLIVDNSDFIGFSVTGINQVIPTIILSSIIKEKFPKIKICLGGSLISRLYKSIIKYPVLFDYFDYIILYEGEMPLKKLIESLEKNYDLENVPNLMYRINKEIKINKIIKGLSINELPTPKFNSKDIKNYYSPEPVLPLLSSRGCYWSKCAFCDHSYVYHNKYDSRNIEKLKKDLLFIVNNYNIKNINFHDEAISPKSLKNIINIINDEQIKINWSCNSRFDNLLDKKILKEAYLSGLKVLYFGLESANQRVLDFMNKGTKINIVNRIIKDSYEVGIWNHIFYFIGFPTETSKESLQTINYIKNNIKYIHSSGCSKFSLGKYSIIASNPEKFKINIKKFQKELSINYDFDYQEGTDANELNIIYKSINNNLYYSDISKIIHRDHWVIFANKVKNISEKEYHLLKPWIIYKQVDKKLIVFDIYKGKIYNFTLETKKILDLLKLNKSKSEVIDLISLEYKIPSIELNEKINYLLNILYKFEILKDGYYE